MCRASAVFWISFVWPVSVFSFCLAFVGGAERACGRLLLASPIPGPGHGHPGRHDAARGTEKRSEAKRMPHIARRLRDVRWKSADQAALGRVAGP